MMAFAVLAWSSCNRPDIDSGEDDEEEQKPPVVSEFYEFPLNSSADIFEGGDNGVTITVKEAEIDNVIFEIVPGKGVSSYRLVVYPKAVLYNFLLTEGCVDASAEACENAIIKLLSDGSTTEYVFNEYVDDFDAKEFDWIYTEYAGNTLVPDCDYYIIAMACYDEDAVNPASLNICSFTTASKELVGNPSIGITAEVGYKAFVVQYQPNADCVQFAHWIWTTEELGQFIDLFGDRLMRDFCRCLSASLDARDETNLAIKRTFDPSMEVVPENTAVAVAMDANGTPAAGISRIDFTLLDIPEGEFDPVAHISANSRVGATLAYFDVTLEKSCMSCFYRLFTTEEAEQLKAMSDEDKKAFAGHLAADGWGVANPNFSFDKEQGLLTGSAFSSSNQHVLDLQPNTSYVLAYVAKNYFGDLSDLCFTEPFRTKPLVRDNPEASEADIELTFTDISRWGFKYNFDYTFDKTACYRFQLVWPYIVGNDESLLPPHYINDADDREKWLKFFLETFEDGPAGPVPVANMWETDMSGHDEISMYGFESGVTYVYAYCGEDWNGVLGPVKFVEVTTEAPTPGPDPQVTLQDLAYDAEYGEITGTVVANEDSKFFKYVVVTSATPDLYANCALDDLVGSNRRDYNTYLANWEKNLMEYGFDSYAEYAAISETVGRGTTPILIAAMSVGEKDGVDVYSPLACKIFYNGEFCDLSDFRTPPAK